MMGKSTKKRRVAGLASLLFFWWRMIHIVRYPMIFIKRTIQSYTFTTAKAVFVIAVQRYSIFLILHIFGLCLSNFYISKYPITTHAGIKDIFCIFIQRGSIHQAVQYTMEPLFQVHPVLCIHWQCGNATTRPDQV